MSARPYAHWSVKRIQSSILNALAYINRWTPADERYVARLRAELNRRT